MGEFDLLSGIIDHLYDSNHTMFTSQVDYSGLSSSSERFLQLFQTTYCCFTLLDLSSVSMQMWH